MNVLVLNPPFKYRFDRAGRWHASPRGMSLWYPKWLAYATGVLEDNNHKVTFIDSPAESLSLENLLIRVKKIKPELVVCDTSTPGFSYECKVCSQIKSVIDTDIVMVGTHVSALPEISLKKAQDVKYIAYGEYDYTLAELADKLEHEEDTTKIRGIAYKNRENITKNSPRPLIDNLDELPFVTKVYKKHLKIKNYSMDFLRYPYIDIMTGRGCPHQCVYCLWPQTLMGRKYRKRSLDNIFQEIDYNIDDKYVNEIFFDDDTFTADIKRIMNFCQRVINEKYDFIWSINCRPDIVDNHIIHQMAKAGCRLMVVGYESGSQQLLKNIKKGTNIEDMIKFTNLCKEEGIKIHGDFMIGLPGETKETIEQTIKLAKKIMPDTFQISIATPYPGTEFYKWLKNNKYLLEENFDEWLDENGQQKCIISYPELSKTEMEDVIKKAVVGYYLDPKYLMKTAKVVTRDVEEFKRYMIGGMGFLKQFYRWYFFRKN